MKKLVRENLNEDMETPIILKFYKYEIDNILDALKQRISKEYSNCKWERQPDGQHFYTPNKKCKQLKFTINSIKRQLENN